MIDMLFYMAIGFVCSVVVTWYLTKQGVIKDKMDAAFIGGMVLSLGMVMWPFLFPLFIAWLIMQQILRKLI